MCCVCVMYNNNKQVFGDTETRVGVSNSDLEEFSTLNYLYVQCTESTKHTNTHTQNIRAKKFVLKKLTIILDRRVNTERKQDRTSPCRPQPAR